MATLAGNNARPTDVVGNVGEIDCLVRRRAGCKKFRNVRHFHKAVAGFKMPKIGSFLFNGEAIRLRNPRRRQSGPSQDEHVLLQRAVELHVPEHDGRHSLGGERQEYGCTGHARDRTGLQFGEELSGWNERFLDAVVHGC